MSQTSRQGLTVFISSSIPEFANLRIRLGREIDEIGFLTSIVLETTGARPIPVIQEALSQTRNCDVFLAIFGEKYSEITVKEYEEARKTSKPCFVYTLKLDVQDPRLPQFIKERVYPFVKCHSFGSGDELIEIVRNDLTGFMGDVIRLGIAKWVAEFQSNQVPEPPKPVLEQIASAAISAAVSNASKTIEDYLAVKGEKFDEFRIARTGPQWVRILAALSRTRTGLTSSQIDSATGIYGAVRWMRVRELQNDGLAAEVYDVKKKKYVITERGADVLSKWLKKAKEELVSDSNLQ